MPLKKKISLQINLCPGDYRHVQHLLKHQLSILSHQVDEIILTVDTRQGKGRFSDGWETYRDSLTKFLKQEIECCYDIKTIPVDYSDATKRKVAEYFFDKSDLPLKDFRGGPFYAYFFGLYTASNNIVFHLDSDMFLGGGSQTWLSEAMYLLQSVPSCLIISPLPGPPHPLDILKRQDVVTKLSPYTWEFKGMSTRIFLIDKSRFKKAKLELTKPSLRNQFKAIIEGHDNIDLPEHLISAYMSKQRFKRVDFLGKGKGLWSLHPPYRTDFFYNELPNLIQRINANNLPEEQLGFYDIIDEVCNWTEARERIKNNRWWKRL